MNYQYKEQEKGQGLVEYALILTLVAVVVIVILTVLGPIVANVYTNVGEVLDGGPITNVTVARDRGASPHVSVSVTVTEETSVTFELNGRTATKNCKDTCQHMFNKVPDGTGQIKITAGDDEALVIYPP